MVLTLPHFAHLLSTRIPSPEFTASFISQLETSSHVLDFSHQVASTTTLFGLTIQFHHFDIATYFINTPGLAEDCVEFKSNLSIFTNLIATDPVTPSLFKFILSWLESPISPPRITFTTLSVWLSHPILTTSHLQFALILFKRILHTPETIFDSVALITNSIQYASPTSPPTASTPSSIPSLTDFQHFIYSELEDYVLHYFSSQLITTQISSFYYEEHSRLRDVRSILQDILRVNILITCLVKNAETLEKIHSLISNIESSIQHAGLNNVSTYYYLSRVILTHEYLVPHYMLFRYQFPCRSSTPSIPLNDSEAGESFPTLEIFDKLQNVLPIAPQFTKPVDLSKEVLVPQGRGRPQGNPNTSPQTDSTGDNIPSPPQPHQPPRAEFPTTYHAIVSNISAIHQWSPFPILPPLQLYAFSLQNYFIHTQYPLVGTPFTLQFRMQSAETILSQLEQTAQQLGLKGQFFSPPVDLSHPFLNFIPQLPNPHLLLRTSETTALSTEPESIGNSAPTGSKPIEFPSFFINSPTKFRLIPRSTPQSSIWPPYLPYDLVQNPTTTPLPSIVHAERRNLNDTILLQNQPLSAQQQQQSQQQQQQNSSLPTLPTSTYPSGLYDILRYADIVWSEVHNHPHRAVFEKDPYTVFGPIDASQLPRRLPFPFLPLQAWSRMNLAFIHDQRLHYHNITHVHEDVSNELENKSVHLYRNLSYYTVYPDAMKKSHPRIWKDKTISEGVGEDLSDNHGLFERHFTMSFRKKKGLFGIFGGNKELGGGDVSNKETFITFEHVVDDDVSDVEFDGVNDDDVFEVSKRLNKMGNFRCNTYHPPDNCKYIAALQNPSADTISEQVDAKTKLSNLYISCIARNKSEYWKWGFHSHSVESMTTFMRTHFLEIYSALKYFNKFMLRSFQNYKYQWQRGSQGFPSQSQFAIKSPTTTDVPSGTPYGDSAYLKILATCKDNHAIPSHLTVFDTTFNSRTIFSQQFISIYDYLTPEHQFFPAYITKFVHIFLKHHFHLLTPPQHVLKYFQSDAVNHCFIPYQYGILNNHHIPLPSLAEFFTHFAFTFIGVSKIPVSYIYAQDRNDLPLSYRNEGMQMFGYLLGQSNHILYHLHQIPDEILSSTLLTQASDNDRLQDEALQTYTDVNNALAKRGKQYRSIDGREPKSITLMNVAFELTRFEDCENVQLMKNVFTANLKAIATILLYNSSSTNFRDPPDDLLAKNTPFGYFNTIQGFLLGYAENQSKLWNPFIYLYFRSIFSNPHESIPYHYLSMLGKNIYVAGQQLNLVLSRQALDLAPTAFTPHTDSLYSLLASHNVPFDTPYMNDSFRTIIWSLSCTDAYRSLQRRTGKTEGFFDELSCPLRPQFFTRINVSMWDWMSPAGISLIYYYLMYFIQVGPFSGPNNLRSEKWTWALVPFFQFIYKLWIFLPFLKSYHILSITTTAHSQASKYAALMYSPYLDKSNNILGASSIPLSSLQLPKIGSPNTTLNDDILTEVDPFQTNLFVDPTFHHNHQNTTQFLFNNVNSNTYLSKSRTNDNDPRLIKNSQTSIGFASPHRLPTTMTPPTASNSPQSYDYLRNKSTEYQLQVIEDVLIILIFYHFRTSCPDDTFTVSRDQTTKNQPPPKNQTAADTLFKVRKDHLPSPFHLIGANGASKQDFYRNVFPVQLADNLISLTKFDPIIQQHVNYPLVNTSLIKFLFFTPLNAYLKQCVWKKTDRRIEFLIIKQRNQHMLYHFLLLLSLMCWDSYGGKEFTSADYYAYWKPLLDVLDVKPETPAVRGPTSDRQVVSVAPVQELSQIGIGNDIVENNGKNTHFYHIYKQVPLNYSGSMVYDSCSLDLRDYKMTSEQFTPEPSTYLQNNLLTVRGVLPQTPHYHDSIYFLFSTNVTAQVKEYPQHFPSWDHGKSAATLPVHAETISHWFTTQEPHRTINSHVLVDQTSSKNAADLSLASRHRTPAADLKTESDYPTDVPSTANIFNAQIDGRSTYTNAILPPRFNVSYQTYPSRLFQHHLNVPLLDLIDTLFTRKLIAIAQNILVINHTLDFRTLSTQNNPLQPHIYAQPSPPQSKDKCSLNECASRFKLNEEVFATHFFHRAGGVDVNSPASQHFPGAPLPKQPLFRGSIMHFLTNNGFINGYQYALHFITQSHYDHRSTNAVDLPIRTYLAGFDGLSVIYDNPFSNLDTAFDCKRELWFKKAHYQNVPIFYQDILRNFIQSILAKQYDTGNVCRESAIGPDHISLLQILLKHNDRYIESSRETVFFPTAKSGNLSMLPNEDNETNTFNKRGIDRTRCYYNSNYEPNSLFLIQESLSLLLHYYARPISSDFVDFVTILLNKATYIQPGVLFALLTNASQSHTAHYVSLFNILLSYLAPPTDSLYQHLCQILTQTPIISLFTPMLTTSSHLYSPQHTLSIIYSLLSLGMPFDYPMTDRDQLAGISEIGTEFDYVLEFLPNNLEIVKSRGSAEQIARIQDVDSLRKFQGTQLNESAVLAYLQWSNLFTFDTSKSAKLEFDSVTPGKVSEQSSYIELAKVDPRTTFLQLHLDPTRFSNELSPPAFALLLHLSKVDPTQLQILSMSVSEYKAQSQYAREIPSDHVDVVDTDIDQSNVQDMPWTALLYARAAALSHNQSLLQFCKLTTSIWFYTSTKQYSTSLYSIGLNAEFNIPNQRENQQYNRQLLDVFPASRFRTITNALIFNTNMSFQTNVVKNSILKPFEEWSQMSDTFHQNFLYPTYASHLAHNVIIPYNSTKALQGVKSQSQGGEVMLTAVNSQRATSDFINPEILISLYSEPSLDQFLLAYARLLLKTKLNSQSGVRPDASSGLPSFISEEDIVTPNPNLIDWAHLDRAPFGSQTCLGCFHTPVIVNTTDLTKSYCFPYVSAGHNAEQRGMPPADMSIQGLLRNRTKSFLPYSSCFSQHPQHFQCLRSHIERNLYSNTPQDVDTILTQMIAWSYKNSLKALKVDPETKQPVQSIHSLFIPGMGLIQLPNSFTDDAILQSLALASPIYEPIVNDHHVVNSMSAFKQELRVREGKEAQQQQQQQQHRPAGVSDDEYAVLLKHRHASELDTHLQQLTLSSPTAVESVNTVELYAPTPLDVFSIPHLKHIHKSLLEQTRVDPAGYYETLFNTLLGTNPPAITAVESSGSPVSGVDYGQSSPCKTINQLPDIHGLLVYIAKNVFQPSIDDLLVLLQVNPQSPQQQYFREHSQFLVQPDPTKSIFASLATTMVYQPTQQTLLMMAVLRRWSDSCLVLLWNFVINQGIDVQDIIYTSDRLGFNIWDYIVMTNTQFSTPHFYALVAPYFPFEPPQ